MLLQKQNPVKKIWLLIEVGSLCVCLGHVLPLWILQFCLMSNPFEDQIFFFGALISYCSLCPGICSFCICYIGNTGFFLLLTGYLKRRCARRTGSVQCQCYVPDMFLWWKRRKWESKKDASMQNLWQEVPQELHKSLVSTQRWDYCSNFHFLFLMRLQISGNKIDGTSL